MIHRTSTPPKGPRHGSPNLRSRGGIQKRRSGPARVDKDGDLVMDPANDKGKAGRGRLEGPSSRGQPSTRGTRGSSRGNIISQRAQSAILRGLGAEQATVLESRISRGTGGNTTLRVDGLKSSKAATNSDGGLASLLSFLERKANGLDAKSKRTIKIKKSHKDRDSVIITASPEDAETFLKLNNFLFAGSTLTIQICETSSASLGGKKGENKEELSEEAKQIHDKIRAILGTRYDSNLKLLNLSALGQDRGLQEMGFFNENKTVSKLFPVLMKVCDRLFSSAAQKREAIISVTLADNDLVNVSLVTALAQTFPELKNLDLSRNMFTELRGLEAWRWKFRKLENLVLTGNPIETQVPDYKSELIRWYPKLLFLSGTQVRMPEEVAAAVEAARSPIPVKGPDFRDISQVGENFIRQFLPLYDTDRATLATSFYDNESLFSLSTNMSAPRDSDHFVPTPPWVAYTKHSRNLNKLTHAPSRLARRYRGIQAIQEVWSGLPATRHPDLATQADKYLVDCHPLPGLPDPTGQSPRGVDGLTLSIHGEFEEDTKSVSDKSLRSFSRTFVLGPGAPGGPQIRVISDVMVLRAWGPLAQPSGSVKLPMKAEGQQQEEMAAKLVEVTGMKPEFAALCLSETGWDIEKAFAAFNANKDTLPAEAFIATGPVAGPNF